MATHITLGERVERCNSCSLLFVGSPVVYPQPPPFDAFEAAKIRRLRPPTCPSVAAALRVPRLWRLGGVCSHAHGWWGHILRDLGSPAFAAVHCCGPRYCRPCNPSALGLGTNWQRSAEYAIEQWMSDSAYDFALTRTAWGRNENGYFCYV